MVNRQGDKTMITIQKQNVANWLMAEYLATSHTGMMKQIQESDLL
jgi:hypothetical protein